MVSNAETIYIPIGVQCRVPYVLKNLQLRKNSYPFDWIFI